MHWSAIVRSFLCKRTFCPSGLSFLPRTRLLLLLFRVRLLALLRILDRDLAKKTLLDLFQIPLEFPPLVVKDHLEDLGLFLLGAAQDILQRCDLVNYVGLDELVWGAAPLFLQIMELFDCVVLLQLFFDYFGVILSFKSFFEWESWKATFYLLIRCFITVTRLKPFYGYD